MSGRTTIIHQVELCFNDFQNSTSLLVILKIIPAGAKVSAGLSPAGSWDRQTGMFSPDTGLMRP